MSGLGPHFALPTKARGHLLDEMGSRGDLRLLALGDLEPGSGQCRLDLAAGHALRFHDALSLILGHLGRYGKPEARKGEADERMEGVQRPPGGCEVRG